MDTVKCYLDSQLLMTYTEPEKMFAIASKDEKSGDLIVKVVNAYATEVPMDIKLNSGSLAGKSALLTTLSARSLTAENSYEYPKNYLPVTQEIQWLAGEEMFRLKPYSINILRFS